MRVVVVVHAHGDAAAGELRNFADDWLAAVRRVGDCHRAGAGNDEVGGPVLVAMGMAPDDDRFRPTGDEPGDIAANDGLAEHDSAEDVADRPVWRLPHLLEVELLNACFVRRDGGALHGDAVLLRGLRRIDRHLVIGGFPVLHPEVVILEFDVEVREDEPVLDELPDDAGHLVAVHLDDGVGDFDLCHLIASLTPDSGGCANHPGSLMPSDGADRAAPR